MVADATLEMSDCYSPPAVAYRIQLPKRQQDSEAPGQVDKQGLEEVAGSSWFAGDPVHSRAVADMSGGRQSLVDPESDEDLVDDDKAALGYRQWEEERTIRTGNDVCMEQVAKDAAHKRGPRVRQMQAQTLLETPPITACT